MKSSRMTICGVVAMVLRITVGVLINEKIVDHEAQGELSDYISYSSVIFLRLITMIIAPPVCFTLVAEIGRVRRRPDGCHANVGHANEWAEQLPQE